MCVLPLKRQSCAAGMYQIAARAQHSGQPLLRLPALHTQTKYEGFVSYLRLCVCDL